MDLMNYAYTTSMKRVQDKTWTYPEEIGQSRRSISRAQVITITEEECVRTTASGLI